MHGSARHGRELSALQPNARDRVAFEHFEHQRAVDADEDFVRIVVTVPSNGSVMTLIRTT
ncbi:hypothetical protein [Burkholderia dolosa]|uniref:hypothetical protein n=1 Tax=Burkholderia dolosa TaxID=152500 RepID=UPI00201170DB|nr:hypothetical protein [Burkholderia dolosa]